MWVSAESRLIFPWQVDFKWDPRDVFLRGLAEGEEGGSFCRLLLASQQRRAEHELATQRPALLVPGGERGLEMSTRRAESGPQKTPGNPPPPLPHPLPVKTLGGRVRRSPGMRSEESVTYLLAELGEPCLSQPLPSPARLPHLSLPLSPLTYPDASRASRPSPSIPFYRR